MCSGSVEYRVRTGHGRRGSSSGSAPGPRAHAVPALRHGGRGDRVGAGSCAPRGTRSTVGVACSTSPRRPAAGFDRADLRQLRLRVERLRRRAGRGRVGSPRSTSATSTSRGSRGKVGLDAGCGKGRYTRFLAQHLDAEVALDGSSAAEAAARNLADIADVGGRPLRPARRPVRPGELRLHLEPGRAPPPRRPVRRLPAAAHLPRPGGPDPALPLQPPADAERPVGRPVGRDGGSARSPSRLSHPTLKALSTPDRRRPLGGVRRAGRVGGAPRGRRAWPTCRWTPTGASRSAAWSSTRSTG